MACPSTCCPPRPSAASATAPVAPAAPLLQGFSDSFVVPVSRWTEVRDDDVALHPELEVLIHSEEVGPCLIEDRGHRAYYMFNHLEYDRTTLQGGVRARPRTGGPIDTPVDYFPDDDPARPPQNRWRSHGQLLYGNWINQIYQTTPYEIEAIGG